MEHQEQIRYIPGSRDGVLLIHGICGTPRHFRELLPAVPEDASFYNILLDGHGQDVTAFSRTSMEKWRAQVERMLELVLSRHERVFLVAHSMGTLFAIRGAIAHPEKVCGLLLLAVPTRPWVRLSTMCSCLKVCWGKVSPEDARARAMQEDCSIVLTRKLWKYLGWIPRFWELLVECSRVRKLLPRLAVPARVFQSRVDELVSIGSIRDLEGLSPVDCTVLEDSGHFSYGEADMSLICRTLDAMLLR